MNLIFKFFFSTTKHLEEKLNSKLCRPGNPSIEIVNFMPQGHIGILTLRQGQNGYIVLVYLYIGKIIILYSHTSLRKTGFDFIVMYFTMMLIFCLQG